MQYAVHGVFCRDDDRDQAGLRLLFLPCLDGFSQTIEVETPHIHQSCCIQKNDNNVFAIPVNRTIQVNRFDVVQIAPLALALESPDQHLAPKMDPH